MHLVWVGVNGLEKCGGNRRMIYEIFTKNSTISTKDVNLMLYYRDLGATIIYVVEEEK